MHDKLTCSTPAYLYSRAALRRRIDELRSAFAYQPFELLFATMANAHPVVLGLLAEAGVGACVNSRKHLLAALESGIPVGKIQHTASGLHAETMRDLQLRGVMANLDSINQAEVWSRIGPEKPFGLRINAALLRADGAMPPDRLGVDPGTLLAWAGQSPAARQLRGLHVYAGTNFHDYGQMLPAFERLFQLARQLPQLGYVNLGGGIGVNYDGQSGDFDLPAFGRSIVAAARQTNEGRREPLKIYFEPGRGVMASTGWFVVEVTDVKDLATKRYVAVNGSVAQFPRPIFHPDSRHRVHCLRPTDEPLVQSAVVGSTTFSRDILADTLLPADVRVGDRLVFEDSGAYCESMRSQFLGQDDPNIVFVD